MQASSSGSGPQMPRQFAGCRLCVHSSSSHHLYKHAYYNGVRTRRTRKRLKVDPIEREQRERRQETVIGEFLQLVQLYEHRVDKRVDGNEELANMVDRVTKVAHRIKGEMVVEKSAACIGRCTGSCWKAVSRRAQGG